MLLIRTLRLKVSHLTQPILHFTELSHSHSWHMRLELVSQLREGEEWIMKKLKSRDGI